MAEGLDLHLGVDKAAGMPWLKWYKEFTHEWSKLLDRLAPSLGSMTTTMLFSQQPPFVPEGVEAMTVRIDLPPGDSGSPPLSGRGKRSGNRAGTSSTTRPPTTSRTGGAGSWW